MSYKYSIIIPIYKAQDTLRRCVDSLLTQNYMDAELVLVNDGSPDNCGAICEEYCEKYPQVKYIAKKNGGVSSARNVGLRAASGTYILFVDSDDYVTGDYFEKLDMTLEEYDWDYVMFSAYHTDGVTTVKRPHKPASAKSREMAVHLIADAIANVTINSPWAKIYKRSIIDAADLCFEESLSIAEDWSFNIAYALNVNNFKISEEPLYYVSLENADSLSRRIIQNYDEQSELAKNLVEKAMQASTLNAGERETIEKALNFSTFRSVYTRAKQQHRQKICLRQRLRNIREFCKKINARKLKIPDKMFCRMIKLTVRLKLAVMIDLVAWKLVKKART